MRILHTSDWHLGRLFHGRHLTEDQAVVLDRFVDLTRDLAPVVVVFDGAVYDRAGPPPDAVELLDDTLARLVLGLKRPTLVIAGNHDSAERLGFGGRLLAGQGLHVVGPLRHAQVITLADAAGPVEFVPLPYASPEVVRAELERAHAPDGGRADDGDPVEIRGHESGLRAQLGAIAAGLPAGRRRVAIGHAFVAGGEESESERALTVGGTGAVPYTLFDGFHYTALGHLHRPQSVGRPEVRYSGSLLPYSFSEVDAERGPVASKSVSLVELASDGAVRVEAHPLAPLRGMRILRGLLDTLLASAGEDPARDDYLLVRLEDPRPRLDVMAKLREHYPNVLHVERTVLQPGLAGATVRRDHRGMSPADLFEDFFGEVTGGPLPEDARALVARTIDELSEAAAGGAR